MATGDIIKERIFKSSNLISFSHNIIKKKESVEARALKYSQFQYNIYISPET
ncbi:uncharacterized protein RNJ42_00585 [Nakaseomyces bracarensis]|uniref:uncharacterized protein n=1 Tax=Nakaseomyces bracarensis TaxID=273131 RepID=UPI0038718D17